MHERPVTFSHLIRGGYFKSLCYNQYKMNSKVLTSDIRQIYECYVLKDASVFSVSDYNNFEKAIWDLKDKYHLDKSPFLLLPAPAKEADFEMMNASKDGMSEPSLSAKMRYINQMKESYGIAWPTNAGARS